MVMVYSTETEQTRESITWRDEGGWDGTGGKLGCRRDVEVRLCKTNVAADEPVPLFNRVGWLHWGRSRAVADSPVRPR